MSLSSKELQTLVSWNSFCLIHIWVSHHEIATDCHVQSQYKVTRLYFQLRTDTKTAVPEISLSTGLLLRKVPYSDTFQGTEANAERIHTNMFALRQAECHNSDAWLGHRTNQDGGDITKGQCSSPRQVMWDSWWKKWHRGTFSPSTSVSPAKSQSTDCSTLIIYHPGLVQWASSGRSTKWTKSHPTPRK
jgi:hypothetical protein